MGVWDGLDGCEISRPEILSQSAPGSGLQSTFRDSFDSVRDFRARYTHIHTLSFSHTHAHTHTHTHTHTYTYTHTLTTVHSVSRTARSRRLEGKLHDQPPTAERHTPSSLYTQNTSHLPDEARHSKYQKRCYERCLSDSCQKRCLFSHLHY